MTIGVCKDCTDRHPACWGTCEKYLAARRELEKKKAEIAKQNKAAGAANAVQYNAMRKLRRRK